MIRSADPSHPSFLSIRGAVAAAASVVSILLCQQLAIAAPAPIAPRSLDGEAADAVRVLLGEPDLAHEEGAGALWTYRFEGCVLMIAFRDAGHGPKVTAAQAGARRRGGPELSASECIAAGVSAHREAAAHPPPLPRETTIGAQVPR